MKIEYLYSDVTDLYGDSFNIEYLLKCITDDVQLIKTGFDEEPYFVKNDDVNLIYMGSMMERYQDVIIKQLMQYKDNDLYCKKQGFNARYLRNCYLCKSLINKSLNTIFLANTQQRQA